MKTRKTIILAFCFFFSAFILNIQAQTVYSIDASKVNDVIKNGHLKMGNPGPAGKEILINNRFLTLGGRPVIPVMGEIHYARVPREQWEDMILKMKAAGIDIIATYVFWIHHEEIEGQFDWSGDKDLRYFLQLCQKHHLMAYPRIGPWCHGEVRNGGTPDWILMKKSVDDRTNDPVYQNYVKRYYSQIASQMKGLLYKDGGPVIGIQFENEYQKGKSGEPHILWLKKTAQELGIDVPMYSVTGWGNVSVPENEVIPLFGAYAEWPWDMNLEKKTNWDAFRFSSYRDDQNIGNESRTKENYKIDFDLYPYFTCEIGLGMLNTYHRRVIIDPIDGLAMVNVKLGSGSNMPGYYVFTGGSNPHGILTSMEENQDETGYYNRWPEISYDYQTAIRESGEIAPSYHEIKKYHYFLNEFGDRIAPSVPVFSSANSEIQYSVRINRNSGFLFGLNYCRTIVQPERKNVQFSIRLGNETLKFPGVPVNIPDSSIFAWPFNFDMDGVNLKYATSQPLCRIEQKDKIIWIFVQDVANLLPEFCFDAAAINEIETSNGTLAKSGSRYVINNLQPGADCIMSIKCKSQKPVKVLVLSKEESKHSWLLREGENKYFFISESNIYLDGDKLNVFGPSNSIRLKSVTSSDHSYKLNGLTAEGKKNGLFTDYEFTVPVKEITMNLKPLKILDGASFLKTSLKTVNKDNSLFNRLFVKEFSLNNPSAIKSAKMYLFTDDVFRLQINNNWVNQNVISGKLNTIDITGYVQKGENSVLLAFAAAEGDKKMAARIIIEYYNTDRIEFFSDQSWLTTESYVYPSYLTKRFVMKIPEIVPPKTGFNQTYPDFTEYSLSLPQNYMVGLSNVYLKINYAGDRARFRINHLLVTNDFNNNTPWNIGLLRSGNQTGVQEMKLEIYPLTPGYRIYFDDPPLKEDIGKADIKEIKLIPEYKVILEKQDINY
jgi:hypothetical protein